MSSGQVTFHQTDASVNTFDIQFNELAGKDIVIPVTANAGSAVLACDLYADDTFVSTATVQLGELKVGDHTWPTEDEEAEPVVKHAITFTVPNTFDTQGTARCAGTFKADGEDLVVAGNLATNTMSTTATTDDAALVGIAKANGEFVGVIPTFFADASKLSISSQATFNAAYAHATDFGMKDADDADVTEVVSAATADSINIQSEDITFDSEKYTFSFKNVLKNSRKPNTASRRRPVVNTVVVEFQEPDNRSFGFIASPNQDKYGIVECAEEEGCVADTFPVATACELDAESAECKQEKLDECIANYNEDTCSCEDFPSLEQCANPDEVACKETPSDECCTEFGELEECKYFACEKEDAVEAECPCDDFPRLERCSEGTPEDACKAAPNADCCVEFGETQECKEFAEATCKVTPTDECCTEHSELTECKNFKCSKPETPEEECPCVEYNFLDRCQRDACETTPSSNCCDTYSDLEACEKFNCLKAPTGECCADFSTEDKCIVYNCNQEFVADNCPCDRFPTDITECYKNGCAQNIDYDDGCCAEFKELEKCVEQKCIDNFVEADCDCAVFTELEPCVKKSCIAEFDEVKCDCDRFADLQPCVDKRCAENPQAEGCPDAASSSAIFVAFSAVCVAASIANFIM